MSPPRHCRIFGVSMALFGGLGLLIAPSCKTPRVQRQPSQGSVSEVTPDSSPRSTPTSASIDEITQFMVEAQQELAAQRQRSTEPLEPSTPDTRKGVSNTRVAGSNVVAAPATTPSEPTKPIEVVTSTPTHSPDPDVMAPWIRSLMKDAAQSDAPMRHHLALALALALSAPERAFHPAGLSELTDEEQELLRIFYERFGLLREELDSGGDTGSALRTALADLTASVQAEDPFQVGRMELCSWVREFGDVDVIDPPTFAPTERPSFIWYVELAGLQPNEETATESWSYEFDIRLELLTRDTGIPVIAPIEGRVKHLSSSRVQDLFLRDLFEMPRDLQFDWYTVKLTVTDRRSGAQAQRGIDLLWVPNLAAGAAMLERQTAAMTVE